MANNRREGGWLQEHFHIERGKLKIFRSIGILIVGIIELFRLIKYGRLNETKESFNALRDANNEDKLNK